jgi:peptide chain release factor 1
MMLDRLRAIKHKYQDLELRLSDPVIVGDIKLFSKFHKEYKDLTELVVPIDEYELILSNLQSSSEMLKEADPEMRAHGPGRNPTSQGKKEETEEKLKWMLIPRRSG